MKGVDRIMQRRKSNRRDIQFYSKKNNALIIVHTQKAHDYAKRLEQDETVAGYRACELLLPNKFEGVSPTYIRKEYFPKADGSGANWETDFLIEYTDGRRGIREIVYKAEFTPTAVQLLELSRRYWVAQGIDDWKIVLFAKPGEFTEDSEDVG
ncbi:hypothetical protein SDC9_49040 [bioreactor metagenome]|uniref:TnsA endonuclease N-terminal domain-containing protein n=1 Tax=bioreactor metagenome TaxID=1076179 RepID=A0A644WG00_9ZZZZ